MEATEISAWCERAARSDEAEPPHPAASRRRGSSGKRTPFSESREGAQRLGAAAAEDYSNQLAVRHQVRGVLLVALLLAYIVARAGVSGKTDRVKIVA
jgi:hypothetical protein